MGCSSISAPLMGLAVTYAADRSPGRIIFVYACGSTALLCPLIFGFPTEMWLAHAMFWPTLALSHYAKTTSIGALLVFSAWLLLAFTHEGALVLLLAIAATLAPRGLRSAAFVRAAISLTIVAVLAVAAKITLPPDDYYAGAFLRAALHFFDLEIFQSEVRPGIAGGDHRLRCNPDAVVNMAPEMGMLLGPGDFAGIALHLLASSRSFRPCEQPLLLADRAGRRHAPAWRAGGLCRPDQRRDLPQSISEGAAHPDFAPWGDAMRPRLGLSRGDRGFHVVETGKFVASWIDYRDAITMLAMSSNSDPALGDPRFVSTVRISPALAPLSWFSTIPYLSIILSNFSPNRLVVDPAGNYFWLSCGTATRNRDAELAVPVQARELVRVYSCLHR